MAAPPAATAEIRHRAGLDFLAWPVFSALPADAMVTTRQGGVSTGGYASLNLSYRVGDEGTAVTENRRRAAASFGAGLGDFVFAEQVHGAHAITVTRDDAGAGATGPDSEAGPADALVTAEPGLVLAVLVADCLPIVLLDPAARVLACVHAGWRGTLAGVAASAVAAMRALGARPEAVVAGLGPAIGADRYQVGGDVAAEAGRVFGARADEVLRPSAAGRWLFDLTAANRLELAGAGVLAENIHGADITAGPVSERFFSHRASAPCGRFAALARLSQDAA